jgi:UDP-3-O-[3-hydroxymyristoyl] glucosamine N-acyltransferase
MKFSAPTTVESLALMLGCDWKGNGSQLVTGLNEIHMVEPGDVVFVDHPKYYQKALDCAATVVLINKEVEVPVGKSILISEDPFRDFNKLIAHYHPVRYSEFRVHPKSHIGKGTKIEPGVFIDEGAMIGNNCIIHSNVSIHSNCVIGDNVIIQSNTVIGSEAFYYKKRADRFERLLTCGTVHIKDNVEIGANCTIDKGVTGITRIGAGTKIDNLVQIGHDTQIGKMCLIAAQTGIAGCVVIGDRVTIWGQVGIASGLHIESNVTILAQSGIGHNLEAGKTYFGSPASESRIKFRELATLKRLAKEG